LKAERAWTRLAQMERVSIQIVPLILLGLLVAIGLGLMSRR
jgi:hypothetical protein